MTLLYFLADAFINTFGITKPTEQGRRRAAFFILTLMILLIVALVAVFFALVHLLRS